MLKKLKFRTSFFAMGIPLRQGIRRILVGPEGFSKSHTIFLVIIELNAKQIELLDCSSLRKSLHRVNSFWIIPGSEWIEGASPVLYELKQEKLRIQERLIGALDKNEKYEKSKE